MKDQALDLKISSTLSSFVIISTLFFISLIPVSVYADAFIPSNEYIGYFDVQGVFTVGGNVKNQNDFALIPTISVSVVDGEITITKTITHVPIPAMTDIPFKIKFPEVNGIEPVLLEAELTYEKTMKSPIPIQILYDKTLVTHDDGHVTGRIQNSGNQTIYNPKVFALVHGYENILDVAQNIEFIEKIDPGEIIDFTIYPDPSVDEPVRYYSCFAPVDSSVTPVSAKKNDGKYDFRYDSGAWYYDAQFNAEGTVMTIRGTNSYPIPTYVNFEFPPITGKEEFTVLVNDKPVDFIQSIDEMENWHVAFDVDGQSQTIVTIQGFPQGLPEPILIPKWVKQSASWWSNDKITSVEFLTSIEFLINNGIITVDSKEKTEAFGTIPTWLKITMGWWADEKISDDDFLLSIENLLSRGIILI